MIPVDLVIPNRNNARFLLQCLSSALEQTLPFHEIIVVDDASTDNSVGLLRRLAAEHPRLRLIELPERRGVSAARNTGVLAARAPYISLLDADDFFWSPRKNEQESGLIEAHLPREDLIAFSDIRLVSELGADLGLVSARRRVREGRLFRHLLCLEGLIPRDFTFPRRLHEVTGGFDETLNLYEDWDFKIRLARLAEFRCAGEAGVAYRSNSAGLSRAPLRTHFRVMHHIAWKNTVHLPAYRRWLVRLLAQWGIFRFLRGATWTWLKQRIIHSRWN
jgi:glycosyltransferase involved in cell wall biosynthesis